MTGLLLSVCCFSGFVFALGRLLKVRFEYAPFISISLIGIILFFCALFNQLKTGATFLIAAGLILSAGVLFDFIRNKSRGKGEQRHFHSFLFFGIILFSFFITLGMTFTTVDDYVWWGIVAKYLYLFDHLPTADTTIISRHLGYTPGTSLIHYWFFRLMGEYNTSISYFAQNIILISALFVVVKKDNIRQGLFLFAMSAVFFGLFCGSILTKLQVDYLLSVFFFASLWIYFDGAADAKKIAVLSGPLVYLSIIKEIGFGLALLVLIIIAADVMFKIRSPLKRKVHMLAMAALTAVALVVVKMLWQAHCQAEGFPIFSNAITLETIKASFDIFGDEKTRKGFFIFVKGLFFGEADRLNLPYLIWYAAGLFLMIKILDLSEPTQSSRIRLMYKLLLSAFAVFVVMNYFMQLIVFNIGSSYMHTVGLERYLNIYFAPMFLLFWITYLNLRIRQKNVSNRTLAAVCVVFFLVTGLSRIETAIRREPHFIEAQEIAGKIDNVIAPDRQNKIAVVPGRNDNEIWIQLLYYLLPNNINHGRFPAGSKQAFLKNLKNYDYVLFHTIDGNIAEWVSQTAGITIAERSFYRVLNKNTEQGQVHLTLERMF